MMQRILRLLDRVRKIDFENLTPLQIGVGVLGVIVFLWMIVQIVNIALALAPIAIAGLALFFIVQWLSSESEEIPAEATKSRAQRGVEAALARVFGNNQGRANSAQDDVVIEKVEPVTATVEDVVAVPPSALADDEATATEAAVTNDVDEERLGIKQVINPETGFKEPDISRLIEQEEAKLKEADRVTEDIMAQIEARRRRLNAQSGDGTASE